MTAVISAIAALQDILRVALLWLALAAAAIAAVDWLVRTRRLSPFGAVARFFRNQVDPLFAPIERRVVRAGGLPASAPWWTLGVIVVAGILLLALLDFLRRVLAGLAAGLSGGASGMIGLAVTWTFGILQLAIIVRVISTWLPVSPRAAWVRWSVSLSEPILRQLRRVIPPMGAIDVTPIVAFFLLSIIEGLVLGIIR